jgi:CRISPR-associated protein (TIGR03986 family)
MPQDLPSYSIAIAPYNFVPLAPKVESSVAPPSGDRYHPNTEYYSGYFVCSLKTLTPLYIRSSLTNTEYKEKLDLQEKKEYDPEKHNPEFFNPDGQGIKIPGSSIRGMIRTLVEIVSKSEMEFIGNPKLFYRAVGDTSSLGKVYRNSLRKKQAGYLFYYNNSYWIRPAKKAYNSQFFQVSEDTALALKVLDKESQAPLEPMSLIVEREKKENPAYKWLRAEVWFKPVPPKRPQGIAKVPKNNIKKTDPKQKDWEKGVLIATGWIPPSKEEKNNKGKTNHWIIMPPMSYYSGQNLSIDIELKIEDVLDYINAGATPKIRELNFSVLADMEKKGFEYAIPCFYVIDEDGTVSFGHTAMFRRPYRNNPKLLLGTKQKLEANNLDLAQAIFGVEAGKGYGKAGRVFFEDAVIDNNKPQPKFLEDKDSSYPQILSSPKPTTFQQYLSQDYKSAKETHEKILNYGKDEKDRTDRDERRKKLAYWDSDPNPQIRGYKLYWHRDANSWKQQNNEEVQKAKSQYTRIRPVNKDVFFRFRVRFENLTAVELGALALTLQLPENCAHKLGMGKSLGLGSVTIKSTLVLFNRSKRYTRLFDALSDSPTLYEGIEENSKSIEDFQNAFANALYSNTTANQAWQSDGRLHSLQTILNYSHKPSNSLTKYMTIEPNQFIKRPTLMPPEYYVDQEYSEIHDEPATLNVNAVRGEKPPNQPNTREAQQILTDLTNCPLQKLSGDIYNFGTKTLNLSDKEDKKLVAEAIKKVMVQREWWNSPKWITKEWLIKIKEILGE